MKCNGSIVIHNVLHKTFVWEWNLSVLMAINSVSHISRYLKGQPFSVSAIINLALWLPWQARHQDYNSISITHPKAPNSLLHKAETTLLSSVLQSHEIKEKEIAKVFWKEANSLQWLCTTLMNCSCHHSVFSFQGTNPDISFKRQIIANSSGLHLKADHVNKQSNQDKIFTGGETGYSFILSMSLLGYSAVFLYVCTTDPHHFYNPSILFMSAWTSFCSQFKNNFDY